jgi:hypothetical protein
MEVKHPCWLATAIQNHPTAKKNTETTAFIAQISQPQQEMEVTHPGSSNLV